MISVVYVTNRGPYPLIDERLKHLSQYDLLSDSLRAQRHSDFELICVVRDFQGPRHELRWLGDRVRFVPPKASPWDDLHAFNPSAARNTGLYLARGEVVFFLDDCTTFGPNLLGQIAARAMVGESLVPVYVRPDGSLWHWHDATHCGGIVSVPRQVCIDAGGWEERFAGTVSQEDWEFSQRMSRNGVVFFQSDEATVKLERHEPRSGQNYHRCPHAVKKLVEGQTRANGKWTLEQLRVFTAPTCPFANRTESAIYCLARSKGGCAYDKRPSRQAIEIMQRWELAA